MNEEGRKEGPGLRGSGEKERAKMPEKEGQARGATERIKHSSKKGKLEKSGRNFRSR